MKKIIMLSFIALAASSGISVWAMRGVRQESRQGQEIDQRLKNDVQGYSGEMLKNLQRETDLGKFFTAFRDVLTNMSTNGNIHRFATRLGSGKDFATQEAYIAYVDKECSILLADIARLWASNQKPGFRSVATTPEQFVDAMANQPMSRGKVMEEVYEQAFKGVRAALKSQVVAGQGGAAAMPVAAPQQAAVSPALVQWAKPILAWEKNILSQGLTKEEMFKAVLEHDVIVKDQMARMSKQEWDDISEGAFAMRVSSMSKVLESVGADLDEYKQWKSRQGVVSRGQGRASAGAVMPVAAPQAMSIDVFKTAVDGLKDETGKSFITLQKDQNLSEQEKRNEVGGIRTSAIKSYQDLAKKSGVPQQDRMQIADNVLEFIDKLEQNFEKEMLMQRQLGQQRAAAMRGEQQEKQREREEREREREREEERKRREDDEEQERQREAARRAAMMMGTGGRAQAPQSRPQQGAGAGFGLPQMPAQQPFMQQQAQAPAPRGRRPSHAAALAQQPSAQGRRIELPSERVETSDPNLEYVAWVEVPGQNDSVFVAYGKSRGPRFEEKQGDFVPNFRCVSPNVSSEETSPGSGVFRLFDLPTGLCLWKGHFESSVDTDLNSQDAKLRQAVRADMNPVEYAKVQMKGRTPLEYSLRSGSQSKYRYTRQGYSSEKWGIWKPSNLRPGETVEEILLENLQPQAAPQGQLPRSRSHRFGGPAAAPQPVQQPMQQGGRAGGLQRSQTMRQRDWQQQGQQGQQQAPQPGQPRQRRGSQWQPGT